MLNKEMMPPQSDNDQTIIDVKDEFTTYVLWHYSDGTLLYLANIDWTVYFRGSLSWVKQTDRSSVLVYDPVVEQNKVTASKINISNNWPATNVFIKKANDIAVIEVYENE